MGGGGVTVVDGGEWWWEVTAVGVGVVIWGLVGVVGGGRGWGG